MCVKHCRKVGTCGSFFGIVGKDRGQRVVQIDQPLVEKPAEQDPGDRLGDRGDPAAVVAVDGLAARVAAEGLVGDDHAAARDERHERLARVVGPRPAHGVDPGLGVGAHAGLGG